MAQVQDSSGLHSLAALRQLELERNQKQAEEARARAEAAQRARLLAEAERAREAERRAEAERLFSRSRESAQMLELAELERERLRELERAESEARARRELELCLAQEKNARRQAEIQFVARAARARLLGSFFGALCLLTWLGAAGAYWGLVRPFADRSRAGLELAHADEERLRSDMGAIAARAREREAALGQRLSSLEQALRDESAVVRVAKAGAGEKQARPPLLRPGVVPSISQPPCRDDGDPLNPCLKR